MKAVLISIRPGWCEKIANETKTVEVRKTKPKLEPPFKCFIYCTKPSYEHEDFFVFDAGTENSKAYYGGGKVIGEFVCDQIYDCDADSVGLFDKEAKEYLPGSCMSFEQICSYAKGMLPLYGWHISDLKIYDRPKAITEFLIIDKKAVKNCPYRERTGQAEIVTKHNGWIKGSYLCTIDGITWCYPCHIKNIERPPQSWCYVMEV